jgi:hypothetical protein
MKKISCSWEKQEGLILMDSSQLKICFKQVLRQAQHERNINTLREYPFVLSLSKGSCYEFINFRLTGLFWSEEASRECQCARRKPWIQD